MKKVFVANKSSYGSEFFEECDTLDELRRAIVAHELFFEDDDYTDDKYTEELFKKHSTAYTLYEINLHDEEYIQWRDYDGTSWFRIEKKVSNLLSIVREVEGV
jgi:hypothetical protein